jgi:hypothetical protein
MNRIRRDVISSVSDMNATFKKYKVSKKLCIRLDDMDFSVGKGLTGCFDCKTPALVSL